MAEIAPRLIGPAHCWTCRGYWLMEATTCADEVWVRCPICDWQRGAVIWPVGADDV